MDYENFNRKIKRIIELKEKGITSICIEYEIKRVWEDIPKHNFLTEGNYLPYVGLDIPPTTEQQMEFGIGYYCKVCKTRHYRPVSDFNKSTIHCSTCGTETHYIKIPDGSNAIIFDSQADWADPNDGVEVHCIGCNNMVKRKDTVPPEISGVAQDFLCTNCYEKGKGRIKKKGGIE